jgi:hypothetical protein
MCLVDYYQIQDPLRTHSIVKNLKFERKYLTQGSGAPCHVSFDFFSGFFGVRLTELQIDPQLEFTIRPKAQGYIPYRMRFSESLFLYGFFTKTTRVLLETFKRRT